MAATPAAERQCPAASADRRRKAVGGADRRRSALDVTGAAQAIERAAERAGLRTAGGR